MVDVPFVMTGGVNYTFSGSWHTGDALTVSWTSVTVDSPCGAFLWSLNLNTAAEHIGSPIFSSLSAGSYTFTLTADATAVLFAPFTDGYCSGGMLHDAILTGGSFGYCQYGTQPNPAASVITIVTETIVDIAVVVLGGGPLMLLAFDTLIGAPLLLGDLCSQPPPPVPVFTADDFIAGTQIWAPGSFSKRMQALRAAVWGFYCQCIPAPPLNPDPVVFPPPPVLTDPITTGGTVPTIVCDTGDICTSLNAIMRQLAAMNSQLTYARNDIQLIQRQSTPFAYVHGTLHSGLTDAGQFAVQGILAVAVELTSLPARLGEEAGDPLAYFDVGWVTLGTDDGWRRSSPIRHNPQWLDAAPDDTLVGYSFTPGIVANILELVREP